MPRSSSSTLKIAWNEGGRIDMEKININDEGWLDRYMWKRKLSDL